LSGLENFLRASRLYVCRVEFISRIVTNVDTNEPVYELLLPALQALMQTANHCPANDVMEPGDPSDVTTNDLGSLYCSLAQMNVFCIWPIAASLQLTIGVSLCVMHGLFC